MAATTTAIIAGCYHNAQLLQREADATLGDHIGGAIEMLSYHNAGPSQRGAITALGDRSEELSIWEASQKGLSQDQAELSQRGIITAGSTAGTYHKG